MAHDGNFAGSVAFQLHGFVQYKLWLPYIANYDMFMYSRSPSCHTNLFISLLIFSRSPVKVFRDI